MFFHASGFSLTGLGTLGLLVYTLPSSSSSHVLSLLACLSSSSYSVSDVLSTRVRLYDPSRMVLRLSGSPHTASSSSGCTTLPSGLLSVRARSCLFRSVLIYIYTTVQLSYTLAIQVSPSVRPSQLISPSLCVIPAISSSSLYMLFCYGLVALYCSFSSSLVLSFFVSLVYFLAPMVHQFSVVGAICACCVVRTLHTLVFVINMPTPPFTTIPPLGIDSYRCSASQVDRHPHIVHHHPHHTAPPWLYASAGQDFPLIFKFFSTSAVARYHLL